MDGDKTTIFHDKDGSVSEYPGSFLVKEDNWLLRHPDCIDVPDWRAAICSGHYAQVGQCMSHLHTFILRNEPSQSLLHVTPYVPFNDHMHFHVPIKVVQMCVNVQEHLKSFFP